MSDAVERGLQLLLSLPERQADSAMLTFRFARLLASAHPDVAAYALASVLLSRPGGGRASAVFADMATGVLESRGIGSKAAC